jgi:hypothetical protein
LTPDRQTAAVNDPELKMLFLTSYRDHWAGFPALALAAAACCPPSGCPEPPPSSLGDALRVAQELAYSAAYSVTEGTARGNAIPGDGGTLGKTGKVSLGLRVTGSSSEFPGTHGVVASTTSMMDAHHFPSQHSTRIAGRADLAVGLWKGLPVGRTHVLGLDLLGAAFLSPSAGSADVTVSQGNRVGGGLGWRFGILDESPATPGIDFTIHHEWLPSLSLQSVSLAAGDGGNFSIGASSLKLSGTSWSLEGARHFSRLGGSLGMRRASYEGSANAHASLTGSPQGDATGWEWRYVRFHQTQYWVGGSMDLHGATLVGEFGIQRSRAGDLYNPPTIGGHEFGASHIFLTLGVRLGSR